MEFRQAFHKALKYEAIKLGVLGLGCLCATNPAMAKTVAKHGAKLALGYLANKKGK